MVSTPEGFAAASPEHHLALAASWSHLCSFAWHGAPPLQELCQSHFCSTSAHSACPAWCQGRWGGRRRCKARWRGFSQQWSGVGSTSWWSGRVAIDHLQCFIMFCMYLLLIFLSNFKSIFKIYLCTLFFQDSTSLTHELLRRLLQHLSPSTFWTSNLLWDMQLESNRCLFPKHA